MRALAAVLVLAGCSQKVYSPPSQAYGLGPIAALAPGRQALDIEISRHAEIFDPPINAGTGRIRAGIGDNTEVSFEGAAMFVEDSGPSNADRTLYSGRAGIRNNPNKSGFSYFGGLGGGYAPSGGTFVAADAGISVGYDNCVLVPVAQASGFVSAPLAPRPIDVTDSGPMQYDTPERTVGGVVRGGLRLSLSPSRCRAGDQVGWLSLGMGTTTLVDSDSDATLIGIGLGIEVPL
jgi:hypothetical protein